MNNVRAECAAKKKPAHVKQHQQVYQQPLSITLWVNLNQQTIDEYQSHYPQRKYYLPAKFHHKHIANSVALHYFTAKLTKIQSDLPQARKFTP